MELKEITEEIKNNTLKLGLAGLLRRSNDHENDSTSRVPKVTLYKFYMDSLKEVEENKHLRLGQVLFNKLYEIRPDLSEKIRATNIDPFYCTSENDITEFIEFLETNWKH